MNAYYAAAQRRNVHVIYNAEVIGLNITNGTFDEGLPSGSSTCRRMS